MTEPIKLTPEQAVAQRFKKAVVKMHDRPGGYERILLDGEIVNALFPFIIAEIREAEQAARDDEREDRHGRDGSDENGLQRGKAVLAWREEIVTTTNPEPTAQPESGKCCGCGYKGTNETPCPTYKDGIHCPHWWDGPEVVE